MTKNKTIGQKLSPTLKEIHDLLWEYEAQSFTGRPNYTNDGFHSAVKIFVSALLDKSWEYQESKKMNHEDRLLLVKAVGEHIHELIREYTGIDTHDYYGKN